MVALLEGRNVVYEALISNRRVFVIYIFKGATGEKIDQIVRLCKEKHIVLSFCEKRKLDSMAKTFNHQGVIAKAEELSKRTLKSIFLQNGIKNENGFYILVSQITFDQNLGAILRTALASNALGVIVAGSSRDLLTSNVERMSMGASNYVPVVRESFYSALKFFKSNNFKVFGVESWGKTDYYDADLKGPVLFVFGGEDKSLSRDFLKHADDVLRIPMDSRLNSLNLSVSVGIVVYEKLRQENY